MAGENRIGGFYGDGERLPEAVGRPVSILAPPGLASILIPCCGQLEYTKLCIPSVLQHTRPPYELIFLDIGSLDGTTEYLAGVQAAASLRVEIIRSQTDLGIGAACKEALRQARGEYVVLLNNDTIVTDAWLNQLVSLGSTSPAIGGVGPMSNYAAPPQLVESVPYRFGSRRNVATRNGDGPRQALLDTAVVSEFAAKWREQNRGKWLEVDRLGGFCLLVKRHVLDKMDSLDQWTDLSLFDTDILSAKARQAGFTLACCRDLFVHHFGTRTFAHGAPKPDTTWQEPRLG
jgi:O-antigen biosynthesis protein